MLLTRYIACKFSIPFLFQKVKIQRYGTIKMALPSIVEKHRPASSPEFDYSTLSNYTKFAVKHTKLDLTVSFEKSTIAGSVSLQLSPIAKAELIELDTSFLSIFKINVNNTPVKDFKIHERREPLGSKLTIVPANVESIQSDFTLELEFETTDKCTALQWLNSKQTNSDHPYVFSQLEAIHARSLFPCFDTPAVKSTFTANIASPLPVVFSGISTGSTKGSNGLTTYSFKQEVPIPAYLIGIASGDLVKAKIGPRSHVYTEPYRLKDAQWEFEGDVEQFIKAAESIIFDYEWGTYDILVNVNSYPYGGMESPNMTFATPTLIAHDKTNIDVIAHELAHSWSGNLVTNCSWNHFWLNEGWTVYLERRILAYLHGEPHRHFSALIGWNDLQNSIDSMKNPERFSTLIQNLNDGTDPDDAFSTVPYEKGFNFLFHLETVLGGTKEFDPFIKHYFKKYAKKSLDTYEFLDTLYAFFPQKKSVLDNIDWETWLYKPGMPPKPKFDTTLADNVYLLVDKWVNNSLEFTTEKQFIDTFSLQDIKDFNSNQIVLFLDTLVQSTKIDWTKHELASTSLLKIYNSKIIKSQNAEVIFRTFRFQITGHLEEYYPQLGEWLGTVGRMKFVRPGYRLLNSVDRKLALETFEKFKDSYHPICKALVKQDLEI
ncbi:hypothetical protein TBLA_0G02440 [Henningerozyma blattae CBS 6284]|uniref:Leukotriene A(4) hydrolase n=1 Tax=Henningerozyma blattae (strain ATCC 34711 / CBS 6284 / DSM 70876 / NBRC 10599 / NRRL Y-10934 / UCD 77-7) TaxID=1071380 RepID=I2H732_HENB6|nr:hypothetical protein TBLA_0G02440 [Tetrapisispora blattae CBS 6284]CCH62184.1 hypothetical protein TBLA_0G02440 [Tetrapisispora blattae CBS 6284]